MLSFVTIIKTCEIAYFVYTLYTCKIKIGIKDMTNLFGNVYNNPMMYTASGCGFTGAGFDPYGSQALGYNLTMGGLNMLGGILNGSINSSESTHKSNDKPAETTKTRLAEIDAEISALETKKENPEKEIDAKYDKNITTASNAVDKAIERRGTLDTSLTTLEGELRELKAKDNTDGSYTKAIQRKETEISEKQAEYDKLNGTGEGSIAKLKEAKAQAEKDKAEAIAAKKEEIQAEIDKLEKEKTELEAQQKDTNFNQVLDAGDGNGVSRLFSPKKRQINNFSDAKNDLVKAIKAGDAEAAKAAAEKLTAEGALPENSSKAKTQKAIDLATKYLDTNSDTLNLIKEGKIDKLTPAQKMQLGVF